MSDKQLTGSFTFEKETKNAVRYQEDEDSPGMGTFGQIYLSKTGLKMAFEGELPETITVTVTV